jgi:hypothetical protein
MTTKDLAGRLTTFSLTMVTEVCINCGIPFGIPRNYQKRLMDTNETFCCPNGHRQHYVNKSESQILKDKLRQKENELAQTTAAKIQIENQLDKANKKLQQVHEGQCPCCYKTYKHLAAHMKNKHPKGI